METSIVTRKGQVTIPARLRRRLQLDEGSVVAFSEEGGELVLRRVEASVEAAFGLVQAKHTASLEDMESGQKVAVEAKGNSPLSLALGLAKSLTKGQGLRSTWKALKGKGTK